MSTTIRSNQILSIRIFNIFSLSMTVSACRCDKSRKPLEEETIRFLFLFKLFEIYVFRELEKTRENTRPRFCGLKLFWKIILQEPELAAACFPFPELNYRLSKSATVVSFFSLFFLFFLEFWKLSVKLKVWISEA